MEPFAPLRISGCVADSIVDGPGLRFTVFVQGCPHHCPGCHNPQTHDFQGGHFVDPQAVIDAVLQDPLASGVTFSGGEPFCQAKPRRQSGQALAAHGKDIVIYTGYTLEQLLEEGKKDPEILALLSLADLLVDGPYLQEQRDLTLQFRGSANQRLLSREQIQEAIKAYRKTNLK